MICQNCGNKEAVMQVNTVSNGIKIVKYICNDCANQLVGSNLSFQVANPFQLMAKILGDYNGNMAEIPRQGLECLSCGTTYRDFMNRGRFGCSQCYETFNEKLIPVFDDLHCSHEYCGKTPQCSEILEGDKKLALLIREKEEAVAREDYETAAKLQKEIRILKEGVQ